MTYWDGTTVTYGQEKPYFSLTLKSPAAARAIFKNLELGFGESYMDGLIDIDGAADQVMRLVSENKAAFAKFKPLNWVRPKNVNVRSNQKAQIQHHYDLGNSFYKLWLDKSMTYSCAYFHKTSDSLEKAQTQKVEHLLRKLQLERGQHMLDIGCGWGTLLVTAAKEYGVKGLGITLSEEQLKHATESAKKAGVDSQVKFELAGYQDIAERPESQDGYDRVISVGMFEHVGRRNQADYFAAVTKMLKPQGISVLHTISHDHETASDAWIDKYIFPGGYIPSIRQVVSALPRYDFRLFDYENLRIHYAYTLDEWLRRFENHKEKVIKMYDERFYRMWRLYLGSSSAAFRYGDLSLSQFVFSKGLNNDLPLTREFLYKK